MSLATPEGRQEYRDLLNRIADGDYITQEELDRYPYMSDHFYSKARSNRHYHGDHSLCFHEEEPSV